MTKRSRLSAAGLSLLHAWRGPSPFVQTQGGPDVPVETGRVYRFDFAGTAEGTLPAELVSVLGDFRVAKDPSNGAGAKLLRQTGTFRNPDFPRVVVKSLCFRDLTLRVACRPESGILDRACGLIFRFVDSSNYYVTRANALEDNVRLYRVKDGDRQQIASADLKVSSGEWHTLEAAAHGTQLRVTWDGKAVLSATDATFEKGKIGLWTKADSITAFREFSAAAD